MKVLIGMYKVNSAASTSTYCKRDLLYLLVVLWWSCHTACFPQIRIPVKSCIWVKLHHSSWRGLRRGGTKWPLFSAAHCNNTVYKVERSADVLRNTNLKKSSQTTSMILPTIKATDVTINMDKSSCCHHYCLFHEACFN